MTDQFDNGANDAAQVSDPHLMDMIGSAKDAQWTPDFLGAHTVVKVVSPAKVNLFLSVGDRRADGYHDAANIMHTLALHDTLYFGSKPFEQPEGAALAGPERNISVRIDISDKTASPYDAPLEIPVEQNLVFKAIDALARATGRTECEAIEVRIEKNIPAQAGLAGGSTDACAALVACAKLWGLPDSHDALYEVAQELGADVAFFLEGGCCEYAGRGEEFVRALEPMKLPVVLVKPDVGVSTKRAYEVLDAHAAPAPKSLATQAEDAAAAEGVPLFNSFDEISAELDPALHEVRDWLCHQDGVRSRHSNPLCMLSGSGATTFAITDSFSDATRIAAAAKAQGWWSRATTFCSLKTAAV